MARRRRKGFPMLNSPRDLRNLQVTHPAPKAAAWLLGLAMIPGLAAAQDFGTHTLPADLADAGVKVQGALRKDPKTNRNLGYSEGPVGDAEGNLYFTEDNAGGATGNIWKVTPAGVGSIFYTGPGMPNGLEFDNQGKLFSAEKGGIAMYDKDDSKTRTMIPMSPALDAGFRINDLTISSNGSMFFTNHAQGDQYFFRDPSGTVTKYNNSGVLGIKTPNGAEYIEEKKILFVTGDGLGKVFKFNVSDNGTVSNRTEFANVKEPDGLTMDEKGNLWVASYNDGAICVFGPDGGTELGRITVNGGKSGNASNCVFGGVDRKTLFITGNGGAYKIQLKVAGRVRPGSVSIARNARYTLAPAAKRDGAYTLEGRKVARNLPATLMLVAAPLAR
jgi:gluconolactonase